MAPAFSIARFVEDARMASPARDEAFVVDWLPNGRTSLVVRVSRDGRGDVHVVGPRTRAKLKRATGFARATVIQFKPGWAPTLFGVSANALTDQLVTLGELWGAAGRDIAADLVAARSVPAMLDRLAHAVATRVPSEPGSARLARRAARMFELTETRVQVVAQQLGITARHLRRAFVESVGIAPKEFARGVRLQRAIHASARSTDWGAIARSAGYYDQSHLIGEFRDLVGLTPSAYLARQHVVTPRAWRSCKRTPPRPASADATHNARASDNAPGACARAG
jgi:AraC-like DNA-binding protein